MIKALILALVVIVYPQKKEPWLDFDVYGYGYLVHNPKTEDVYVRFWCGMNNQDPVVLFHPGDTSVVFKNNLGATMVCTISDWHLANKKK